MAGGPATEKAETAPHAPRIDSEGLLKVILTQLSEDKAEDIVEIDLRGRSEIADYMIVCSGRSTRQVSALAQNLQNVLKSDYERLCKVEGKGHGDWVLIDAGDVVVHVFRPEVREFYQLEKMWLPEGTSTNPPEPSAGD
ncbi:MAG: ribosome silencing factor [Litoreibacter sp.]